MGGRYKNGPGESAALLLDALAIKDGQCPAWYTEQLGLRANQVGAAGTRLVEFGLMQRHGLRSATTWHITPAGRRLAMAEASNMAYMRAAYAEAYQNQQVLTVDEFLREHSVPDDVGTEDQTEPEPVPSHGKKLVEESVRTFYFDEHGVDPTILGMVDELLDNIGVRDDIPRELRLTFACGLTASRK